MTQTGSINLGRIQAVMRSPAELVQQTGANQAKHTNGDLSVETRTVSLQEAQGNARFRILQPTFLPSATLKLTRVQQIIYTSPFTTLALSTSLYYREAPGRWLNIAQIDPERFNLEVPPSAAQGTIAGRPAVYFMRTIPAQNQPNNQLLVLVSYWEHGDVLIQLQAPNLSISQASQVGASLR